MDNGCVDVWSEFDSYKRKGAVSSRRQCGFAVRLLFCVAALFYYLRCGRFACSFPVCGSPSTLGDVNGYNHHRRLSFSGFPRIWIRIRPWQHRQRRWCLRPWRCEEATTERRWMTCRRSCGGMASLLEVVSSGTAPAQLCCAILPTYSTYCQPVGTSPFF